MGDLYPSSNILGVDLSPIQPEWVPPNVRFMVDDVESPWLKPLNHYDYVHARHTVMAIRNWPQLMGRVFEYVLLNSLERFSADGCVQSSKTRRMVRASGNTSLPAMSR